MSNVIEIGQVPWTRTDMVEKLKEFASLYDNRPIKDNTGGMQSPHLFMAWFALQILRPKAIIESGVWHGQGTWFIERACPDADLYCIDVNLDQIKYKSDRARYLNQDFSSIDWNFLPKNETACFFDDHQNAYERVKTAKWFGFKHLFFEDNYPPSQGDCYSLKKAFMHSGFKGVSTHPRSSKAVVKRKIGELLGFLDLVCKSVMPNDADAKYLKQNLEVYYEFPPVFKVEHTRWNDRWDEGNYPTPIPLLSSVEYEYQRLYFDEAIHYTWMCYLRLK